VEQRTPEQVVQLVQQEGVEIVDLRFCDLPGMMQHFSAPAHALTVEVFDEGFGFDGSSIRGFQQIHESDMILKADPTTAVIDPFREHKTLNINCFVHDPVTHDAYSRDPRHIARKAEAYLASTGIADTAYFGPEAEFFIFDTVEYGQGVNFAQYRVDSIEGHWNTNRPEGDNNQGYKLRPKEGYFPVPPSDKFQDMRSEMILTLERLGVEIEIQHHEVATGGQAEIDMRFDSLLRMADKLMLYKYVVKNVAYQAGYTATFMPKPLFEDNGSGMHCHQSLWKDGEPLFYGDGYAGLSDIGRWYVGGLLKHARAVLAFAAPTTNSYKRLVPGYEAPVNLVYSQRNRSASVRIPLYSPSPKAKRIEFRCPDPACNPYLAFPAMLLAGLDGVQNKIEPPEPVEHDLFDMSAAELAKIAHTPGSLEEAMEALEADNDFLRVGGVFTDDLIDTWIDYKRVEEGDAVRLRPHPWEFALYYDI
jgi:glutamine synthetase